MNRQYSGPRPAEPPSPDLGPQQLCHQTVGPTRSLVPQPPRNGEPRAARQGLTRPQGKTLGPEFLWAWSSGGPVPPASAQARMRPHCRVTTWGSRAASSVPLRWDLSWVLDVCEQAGLLCDQGTGHAEPADAGFPHVLSPQPPRGLGVWD